MVDIAQDGRGRLLFTTAQAGTLLGISRTMIYELINRGELHRIHIGHSARISEAELIRFVADRDRRPSADSEARPPAASTAPAHLEHRRSVA